MPTRYRKKPVEIEAFFFDGTNVEEVQKFTGRTAFHLIDLEDRGDDPEILAEVWDTLHYTWVGVKAHMWIIRGIKGEYYPCADDVFKKSYDAV